MRMLLDSHVALWWLTASPRLGATCRTAIIGADQVIVSAVTPWELGIKKALGKLDYPDGLGDALLAAGFELLPITTEHAERAPLLPPHHRDPFDRMLVAQSQLESLQLVTADAAIEPYDVEVVDAGV